MFQWRKFDFFEEKSAGKTPITGRIDCCSSGRGRVVVGCDDGTVAFLDRGFKLLYAFQAHASSVLFLQQLKQRNFLVTIGGDEETSLQASSTCLKIFDLDKMQPEGSSMTSPICIQTLRIFTNQFPEAKITSFVVLEEAPPVLLITIGLDTGSIYCIKGDVARERITRFRLQVDAVPDKIPCPITSLCFRPEGRALQLFTVTPTSVSLFTMHDQPPKRQTLDQIGCDANAVAMSDHMENTGSMRKEIHDLTNNARIFQLSKCTACTFTLDLPAVHFMCMHSFHLRCLGDNEKECPECSPEYKSVLETKRNLEVIGKDQDEFFRQVKNSKDGFSVIADYFGKGIVSKTSIHSK